MPLELLYNNQISFFLKAKKANTKWYTNFLEYIQEQARKKIQRKET